MYKEVLKWLKADNIRISPAYLRVRLESHPDYPSLAAVQDSLAELNIRADAYQTDRQELIKSGRPFLLHLNMGEGVIQYYPSLAAAEKKIPGFTKHWSGVVMVAEKTNRYGNLEHDAARKEERINNLFAALTASLLLLLLTAWLFIWPGKLVPLLLIFTNCAGLYLSWLIVQKEFGISNSISEKICGMAKQSRCESVLFSKGARISSWLSWGDIGIVYFSSSLLFIPAGIWFPFISVLPFYCLLSVAGLLFPLYSLYYQWKMVRQWCMLCLGVLLILEANAAVCIAFFPLALTVTSATAKAAGLFVALSLLLLGSWQLIKRLYKRSLSALSNEIKATRLKRNPSLFEALLERQAVDPINLPAADEAIRFGKKDAPFQLVMGCNPYCGPCAKAHRVMEGLFKKYPGKIAVSVRFVLHQTDVEDETVAAVVAILKAAKRRPLKAVKDWYEWMDIEKFRKQYPGEPEIRGGLLNHYKNWSKKAGIVSTPAVFINGKRLPAIYNWTELGSLLEYQLAST